MNVSDLFFIDFIVQEPAQHALHFRRALEEELQRGGQQLKAHTRRNFVLGEMRVK